MLPTRDSLRRAVRTGHRPLPLAATVGARGG
jgi:hypothetical protein